MITFDVWVSQAHLEKGFPVLDNYLKGISYERTAPRVFVRREEGSRALLEIDCLEGDVGRTVLTLIRGHFPDYLIENRLLEDLRRVLPFFNGVRIRGLVNVVDQETEPNFIEMFVQDIPEESFTDTLEVEIDAFRISDSSHRQIVFESRLPLTRFIQEVLEVWLTSGLVELPGLNRFNAPFQVYKEVVFSYKRGERTNLPKPFKRYAWTGQFLVSYGVELVIKESKRLYTEVSQCFPTFFGVEKANLPQVIDLIIPEHRGRIERVSLDSVDSSLRFEIEIDNPLRRDLYAKIVYLDEGKVLDGQIHDFKESKRFSRELPFRPTKVDVDLIERGFETDLVDRWEYRFARMGFLGTEVGEDRRSLIIDLDYSIDENASKKLEIMSNAYARLFVLENALRQFVRERLKEVFKEQWTEEVLPIVKKGKKKNDIERIEERWKSDPDGILEEVNFADFKKIILDKDLWTTIFKKYFPKKQATSVKLAELGRLRNPIAHTRLLSATDLKRIEVYYVDLINILRKA